MHSCTPPQPLRREAARNASSPAGVQINQIGKQGAHAHRQAGKMSRSKLGPLQEGGILLPGYGVVRM